jgi:hypothetical protein
MLNDAVAVRGISEFEAKNQGVFLGLLQPVSRCPVCGLGFNDCDGEIAAIPQEVIGALLRPPNSPVSDEHDSTVSEALLLTDLIVFPACAIKLREDVGSACVGFV